MMEICEFYFELIGKAFLIYYFSLYESIFVWKAKLKNYS